jgi:DNA-binding LacI/PurR family transcriptional regulator
VAKAAGVSRATASRAINGLPYVSSTARAAVERAVHNLGYRTNQVARSLATKRTGSVALVVAESEKFVVSDPFFARIMRGISSSLGESGLQLSLIMAKESYGDDGSLRSLREGHVDGVLLVSVHGGDILAGQLLESGLPIVVCGRPLNRADVPYVDADNFNGASTAARHLVDIGRRKVATIAGPRDMAVGIDRLSGFRRGMASSGQPTDVVEHGDFTMASGEAAMRRLLEAHPDLDAVFVASDLMAVGALRVLQAAGKSVPGDVAVVGFDDSDVAATAVPPLTTIRQPVEELGRTMAWRLLAQLAGDPDLPPSILLPTEFVGRATT